MRVDDGARIFRQELCFFESVDIPGSEGMRIRYLEPRPSMLDPAITVSCHRRHAWQNHRCFRMRTLYAAVPGLNNYLSGSQSIALSATQNSLVSAHPALSLLLHTLNFKQPSQKTLSDGYREASTPAQLVCTKLTVYKLSRPQK